MSRKRIAGLVVALALTLPARLPASEVREAQIATFTADVTLVTTAETVIVSSGPVRTPLETHKVIILAWAQMTSGAATTAVTSRIRRGTTTAGALVGEANAITIGAAAGGTEVYTAFVQEDRSSQESVEYSLTLAQTSATGNGTALQGGILVLIL